MVIKVDKPGSRDYYDEMLYIISYYKSFIKNPKKKPHKLTKVFLLLAVISILFAIIFIALYFNEKYYLDTFAAGVFSFITIFAFAYLFVFNKRINEFLKDTSPREVSIEKDSVSFKSENLDFKMKREEIALIVRGKESICFLPKEMNKMAISISREYEDKVNQALKENGYED